MKDYIINQADSSKYIRKVRRMQDGTLSVEFGDGRVFFNIEKNDENLEKISRIQEQQAKAGLDHYSMFKTRELQSKAKALLVGVGTLAATTGMTFIPTIHRFAMQQNPVLIATGIGAITLLGTIPAYAKFRRDQDAVTELDKIRYRNNHLAELKEFKKYPNALSGIEERKAKWLSRSNNPFSILSIDAYSKDDLVQIIENIEVEKELGLKYPTEKPRRI